MAYRAFITGVTALAVAIVGFAVLPAKAATTTFDAGAFSLVVTEVDEVNAQARQAQEPAQNLAQNVAFKKKFKSRRGFRNGNRRGFSSRGRGFSRGSFRRSNSRFFVQQSFRGNSHSRIKHRNRYWK